MTAPYQFQLEDVRVLHRWKGRGIVAHDPGLGKTFTSLFYLQKHPDLRPAIVVCPASVKWVWEAQASKHFGMRAEILETTRPRVGGFPTGHPLMVINYDILKHWIEWLREFKPQCVVIDESQNLRNNGSQKTKAVRALCKGVPCVLALSGTPLVSRPAQLWPTLSIVRPDLWPSFWHFAHEHCGAKRTPWGWDFSGSKDLDKLHDKLVATCMVRRRQVDVLGQLPPLRREVVPLDLPDRKEYDEALNDFKGWMKRKNPARWASAEKAQAVVKIGYLLRLVGRLKLPVVGRWVEEFLEGEGKLILFAKHKAVVSDLRERFKKVCVVIDGSTSMRDRRKAVDLFQNGSRTRLCIGNIEAAGKGLTLTAASTEDFCELPWDPGDLAQCEKRAHRIGTKKTVLARYLVARRTVEEPLVKLLQAKQKNVSAVLDGGPSPQDLDIWDRLCVELMKGEGKC